jgi:hypothetical protein
MRQRHHDAIADAPAAVLFVFAPFHDSFSVAGRPLLGVTPVGVVLNRGDVADHYIHHDAVPPERYIGQSLCDFNGTTLGAYDGYCVIRRYAL